MYPNRTFVVTTKFHNPAEAISLALKELEYDWKHNEVEHPWKVSSQLEDQTYVQKGYEGEWEWTVFCWWEDEE